MDAQQLKSDFDRDGYITAQPILTPNEAAHHRAELERAEAERGPLHYFAKLHTVFPSALEMATHPKVLDRVEALIGPDILLYDVTYIVKEPKTPNFVSWHQDLTFWGLDGDAQVSLWLALSEANEESGCMRMIPGSHKAGQHAHATSDDADNVLLQSQTVEDVDESAAVLCPLRPGEASFHHGWVLHASMPNVSDDRRIGLNVQYLAPHMRQTKHDEDRALLVRGEDRYGYYKPDRPAQGYFEPEILPQWEEMNRIIFETRSS